MGLSIIREKKSDETDYQKEILHKSYVSGLQTYNYNAQGIKKNPFAQDIKTITVNDTVRVVKYTQADNYVKNNTKNDTEKKLAAFNKIKQLYAEASVAYVIETDKHKPRNLDVSRISSKILAASEYTGVDADSIACIVKRESHFKEKENPMGITSIAVQDLYARSKLYDKKLEELINKYDSLQKLFAAKKANPVMELGNFGDILYKHGSWTNLRSAVRKDYDLNLKVGAYIYKYQLNKTMTDKKISIANKEREAFKNYNNSYLKESYASSSVTTLKAARVAAAQDEKYLAALDKAQKTIA